MRRGMSDGSALTVWALFTGRSRGQLCCPRYRYLMIGSAGLRCPECGHAVQGAREFDYTRLRWRWAIPFPPQHAEEESGLRGG